MGMAKTGEVLVPGWEEVSEDTDDGRGGDLVDGNIGDVEDTVVSGLGSEVGPGVVGRVPAVEFALVGEPTDIGIDDGGIGGGPVDGYPEGDGWVGPQAVVDNAAEVGVEDNPTKPVLDGSVWEGRGWVPGEGPVVNGATDKGWYMIVVV